MTGMLATCFGLEYRVTEDGTGWYSDPISLDQALNADTNNLETLPTVQKTLEHIHFFHENLPDAIKVSCPIAAGPINNADMVLGKQMWLEFYDRPEKIRALLEKITDVMIALARLYKQAVDEPMESAWIGPLYMSCGGLKIGNDSLVMVSPEMFREFVFPSISRLCQAFSGGYHHSCGYYPKHLDLVCGLEGVTVFNFGEPGLWDMPAAVRQIHNTGKIYYGGWDRLDDEPLDDYLRRGVELCGPQRNRAILYAKGQGDWPEPARTMELWYRLQDEIHPR
jgi:hypothetical protein